MHRMPLTSRVKMLVTLLAVGATAAVAGLGSYGSFTSTTSASEPVTTGTVQLAVGSVDDLTIAATGVVPGDTMQRAVDLQNTGNQDFSAISLTTTAAPSNVLSSDAVNGLQLTIDACSLPWTNTGTASVPTYTCPGTTSAVLASTPVLTTNAALGAVLLTSGSTNHLRVTMTLPTTAGNSFQGLSTTVTFGFTALQRAGTAR